VIWLAEEEDARVSDILTRDLGNLCRGMKKGAI
jgi:hypothetical protein